MKREKNVSQSVFFSYLMLNLSINLGWIGKIMYYFNIAFKGRNGIFPLFYAMKNAFVYPTYFRTIFTLKNCAELNARILERRLMQRI